MFLYFNSFFSYEYLAQLNFDASLCRFWYSCFDARLMLLIIFLSDMSDFFCASLDQCNIQSLQKQQNVHQLINLICEILQLLQQNVANFSIFLWQNLANLGFQMAIFRDAKLDLFMWYTNRDANF